MDGLEVKMRQLKAGDINALDFIYENTCKQVFFLSMSILKNEADSLDIVQETYLLVREK